MGFIDWKMRKQRKRNENTAELLESANDTMGEAGKFAGNLKTMGAFSKRGPLNKYEDPTFVGQADLNSHILENFSEGIMEDQDKEDDNGNPVEKRGCRSYLKKEYRGKSDPYKSFQKKGLLNKVENGDENKRNALVDEMAASRLNADSSIEDIETERSEAEEFLDDVARLNPTKGKSESKRVVNRFTNPPMQHNRLRKEGDVFDYSDRKGEKGKYSKQGKKWLRQSNKLVR